MVDQVVEVTFLCQRRQDVPKAVPRACLLHLWGVFALNPWCISALLCSHFRTILVVMGQWGVFYCILLIPMSLQVATRHGSFIRILQKRHRVRGNLSLLLGDVTARGI